MPPRMRTVLLCVWSEEERRAEARTATEIASHHHANEDGNEEHVR